MLRSAAAALAAIANQDSRASRLTAGGDPDPDEGNQVDGLLQLCPAAAASVDGPPRDAQSHGFPPRVLASVGALPQHHRYQNGRLNIAGEPAMAVLAHALATPRKLMASTLDHYITRLGSGLSASSLARHSLASIVRAGTQHSMDANELLNDLCTKSHLKSPKSMYPSTLFFRTSRLVLRPMALVQVFDVQAVREDSRLADAWDTLARRVTGNDRYYVDDACLAVLVGVEFDGHAAGMYPDCEEPGTNGTRFRLCERLALVVADSHAAMEHCSSMYLDDGIASAHVVSPIIFTPALRASVTAEPVLASAQCANQQSTATSLASPAASSAPPPNTTSSTPPSPATPSALLQATAAHNIRYWRYANGSLHFLDSRGTHSRALAHALIAPRTLPPTVSKRYLDHVLARVRHSGTPSVPAELYKYAIDQCGPARPFTAHEAAEALDVAQSMAKSTLERQIVRALFYVGRAANVEPGNPIWQTLVSKATKWGVSEEEIANAQVVVLVGLEIVGLENPKETDELPGWEQRRFVLRERYALVPGDACDE